MQGLSFVRITLTLLMMSILKHFYTLILSVFLFFHTGIMHSWAESESLSLKTGLSMHGTPLLKKNFKHYPYVNPNALQGGTVTLAFLNIFDSLNPFIILGSAPDAAQKFVLQSLMTRSLDEPFTLYPLIASSFEMPEDRSFIIFNLDKTARFSDGMPLTAKDVSFSFKMLQTKGKPFFRSSFTQVKTVSILEEYRIKFDLSGSENRELPLIIATMPIFASHIMDESSFASPSLKPIIGSGPYIFKEIDPGNRIVLVRNPRYWAQNLPVSKGIYNFDTIIYQFYREANALFESFKAMRYDWRVEKDPGRWVMGYDIKQLHEGRISRESLPLSVPHGMTGLVFNTRKPLFQDIRVRKALASLFDFQWVNKNLYYNTQKRINSYFAGSELASSGIPASQRERELLAPFMTEVEDDILEGRWFPPEPDKGQYTDRKIIHDALALLKEAGWELEKGRLIDKTTCQPFEFEIMVSTLEQERLAVNYSASLAKLGIKARVYKIDDVQFWRRASRFEFDMMQRTWTGSLSPGNEQRNRWNSLSAEQKGSLNYAGIRSAGVDAMIEKLLASETREEFVDAVRALDRLLLSGFYVVPLFYAPDQWIAYNSQLKHPDHIPLLGAPIEIWWRQPD